MFNKLIAFHHTDPKQVQISELMAEIREALAYTWTSTDMDIKAAKATYENDSHIQKESTLLAKIQARLVSGTETFRARWF